ncbi:pyridoxamine 5'-phosphate oxidase family protein [Clostridium pasteurianum]|uniref:Putative flavin-nucleotide-binding protein n=1 Tax=Clostridium pasteurianum BC1 TaxID=86416 RepID=R4K828_CLOPA|nr:pyridoxamine 5'-phosphate oxidase family protein [Clostridium pasteurianum]AGK99337.1 putative flavin-nucleotide-binding protein [Clostridium pasteurianum BC1]
MFKEIRKITRKMEYSQALDFLKSCDYGVLSTIGEDGYPYGLPLSYVFYDNCIYFHCGKLGHKLDNIEFSNKVSFCVIDDVETLPDKFSTKYKSVIVFGTAEEITSYDEKETILTELIKKFSENYLKEGLEYIHRAASATKIIRINIDHFSGKARVD